MPESDDAPLTRERLASDLRALGVEPGDALFVHSSVSAVGIERGPAGSPDQGLARLFGAFSDAVGPDGLVSVPTFSRTVKAPPGEPAGLVWSPLTTPSRVGSFTNFVLNAPGVARSDHPTHSVAAVGRRAAELCAGHSWREGATPFDRRGPWGRLAEWGGKILWLGTDMRSQSFAHAVEDWMGLPYMEPGVVLVADGGGVLEVPLRGMPSGPRDFYRRDSKVERAWDAAGRDRRGRVGRAECRLMGAAEFVDWLWQELIRDPALLLNDDPNDAWSVRAKAATAGHLRGFKGSWRRG